MFDAVSDSSNESHRKVLSPCDIEMFFIFFITIDQFYHLIGKLCEIHVEVCFNKRSFVCSSTPVLYSTNQWVKLHRRDFSRSNQKA